ncbi:MAG: Mu transposase C-terminal domain-containing protein [Clostridium sp.]|uniref:hypothetical protein n=1 Tax=Clostridium sp. TaxID=1506 RepID=UPI002FC658D9
MSRYLMVNDIIRDSGNSKFFRIVWIEQDYSYCFVIELFTKKLNIIRLNISVINSELDLGVLELVEDDPYIKIIDESKLTDRQAKLLNQSHMIIQKVLRRIPEPEFYSFKVRRKVIIDVSNEDGISEKSIYKYLRKYLQGGKTKYALATDLDKCGGKNKKRMNSTVKRGRPKRLSYITGEQIGINIDEGIEKIFNIACNRYYMRDKKMSLAKVYRMMLNEFFSYEVKEGINIERKVKSINEIPTLGQFKYWIYNNKGLDEKLLARLGEKKFNLNYKNLKSDSIYETYGPGFRYQIDATIADVFLVSRIDRTSVIGRPVVYLIIDVFSRMITGVNVCLEGPSWNGASTALYNCMENKVDFCSRYGVNISEEEWPVKGLPQVILADRGELVGPIAENIIQGLRIGLENTPSYMGCAKGLVEQYFHVINTEVKHWLPGEVKKEFRERGVRDYRYDAKLDIIQFTQIIIYAVLKRNKTVMEKYPLTKEMIKDEVKPIPIDIWNWGMSNMTGNLRRLPEDLLRVNLLKRATASIREDGIRYRGMIYTCELAEKENWFLSSRVKGAEYVEIAYDDRDVSIIYLILHSNKIIKAYLNMQKTSNQLFKGATYGEIEDYLFCKRYKITELEDDMNQLNLNFDQEVKKIIKEATDLSRDSKNNIKNIRENRKIENDSHRGKQAIVLESKNKIEKNKNDDTIDYTYKDDSREDMLKDIMRIRKDFFNGSEG